MKTNEKGFTAYEILIVIALISLIFSLVLTGVGFLRNSQEDQREFLEQQLNYGMIEYYGLFGKYPFEYDPVSSTTIHPSSTNIRLNSAQATFVLEELDRYTGYTVEGFDSVSDLIKSYDIELVYRDKHIAQIMIKNKP